jgi:rod shape-determining protein MreC
VVDGDTRPISYQGAENQVFGSAKGVIEFVPLDIYASATVPKRLATSGLGGVYPPGLTIGRITHVEPSADGLFKTGEVELDPRLSELTEVTVLVPRRREIGAPAGCARPPSSSSRSTSCRRWSPR